jgi:hypothetical protein
LRRGGRGGGRRRVRKDSGRDGRNGKGRGLIMGNSVRYHAEASGFGENLL